MATRVACSNDCKHSRYSYKEVGGNERYVGLVWDWNCARENELPLDVEFVFPESEDAGCEGVSPCPYYEKDEGDGDA